ncbi:MAG: hypothetical protein AAFQ82_10095, partial [Myxococcota bacterium]
MGVRYLAIVLGFGLTACGTAGDPVGQPVGDEDPRCVGLDSGATFWFPSGVEPVAQDCGNAGGDLQARYQREVQYR